MAHHFDRLEIEDILRRERLARDMQRWEDLAACYNEDSYVDISWFQGSGAAFAEAGARMASKLLSFHELGQTVTDIRDNRAITDMGVTIHLISKIEGIEVDCVGYCRALGRMERKTDNWLMSGNRVIYVHDWIVPIIPSRVPVIDEARLSRYRPSYRFLSYMLEDRGLPVRDDLAGVDRPDTVETVLKAERIWLEKGPA
jgi:hypothetical protein